MLPSHSRENVAGGGSLSHHLVCLTYASFHKLGMASSAVFRACLREGTVAVSHDKIGPLGLKEEAEPMF